MNPPTHSDASRDRWHGVRQIIRFNWRFYVIGVVALTGGVLAMKLAPVSWWWKSTGILCLGVTAFWMVASLIASHWVYDRSVICKWTWIPDCLPQAPQRWANIHAGLDESSPALAKLFPDAQGDVLDVFDPVEMTEASIAEARRDSGNKPTAIRANLSDLPLADNQFDALFLIFAAHEIRHVEARLRFFAELKRALKPGGRILIVEHLRDWKNFIAYGPGCFHFQSLATWHHAASRTGLTIEREFGITPFVRIFVLLKPSS